MKEGEIISYTWNNMCKGPNTEGTHTLEELASQCG